MTRLPGWLNWKNFYQWWLAAVLLMVEFGLAVYQALRFAVVDQTLWLVSAPAFFNALGRADLAGTYASTILAHPGVSLEWLWGIAQLVSLAVGQQHLTSTLIFLILTVKLILIFWSVRLLQQWLSPTILVACGLIWLSHPLLFGASASWLDQLLGLFLWLTLLLWLSFVQHHRLVTLVAGGVLVGLAGLTKVAGILVFPMLMVPTWRHYRERWWWQGLVVLGLIGAATFVILYPAMWVTPWHALTARATAASGTGVSAAGGNGLMSLLLYPYFIIQDAILFLGLVALAFEVIQMLRHKARLSPMASQLSVAGATYIGCLVAISLSVSDKGSGTFSFMNYRYLTPAVLLLSPLPIQVANRYLPKWGFWLFIGAIISIQIWQGPLIGAWLGRPPAGI